MADRFPLILNTSSNTITELASGDNLDLSGSNIANVGNVTVTGRITATANITATGNIQGNFILGNGSQLTGITTTPGGSNTQLQYNNAGVFAGIANTTFANGNLTLGAIGNVKVTGGTANQVIQTDGSGNLSFGTITADSWMLQPVRAATLLNATSLSGLLTIDGIALNAGDRVLVRRQNTASENGIYVVSASAWSRASDFTTGSNTLRGGVTVTTLEGTQLAGITFVCQNTGTIVINSSAIVWERSTNTGFISIWNAAGVFENKASASANSGGMAIGVGSVASVDSTAVGYNAGTSAGATVAYGYAATASGANGTALGTSTVGLTGGVAVGRGARGHIDSVAIGLNSGAGSSANSRMVAVGYFAGHTNQGSSSIAIGANAGYTNQANNSIILNATGANLNQTTANTFTVRPVRNTTTANIMYYNDTSGEISYGAFGVPAYTISGKPGSGSVGQVISISNSVPAGMLAYWDGTNNRWSYVYDNSAV
jgi:hypothetical protein